MRLAELVHCWRLAHGITVREGARQIGLTPPTLHRFENGRDTSGATLARVMQWALEDEPKGIDPKTWMSPGESALKYGLPTIRSSRKSPKNVD